MKNKLIAGVLMSLIAISYLSVGSQAVVIPVVSTSAIVQSKQREQKKIKEQQIQMSQNKGIQNNTTREVKVVTFVDKKIGTIEKKHFGKTVKLKEETLIRIFSPSENKIFEYHLSDKSDYWENTGEITIKINGKRYEYNGFSYVIEEKDK